MLGVFPILWIALESNSKFLFHISSQDCGFHSSLEAPKYGSLGPYCERAVPAYSETRWWSRWEVMKQILEGFPDVEGFLRLSNNLSSYSEEIA